MKPEMRARIIAYNKARAQDKEKADDLMKILAALPTGLIKLLLNNDTCAAILRKYGVEESGT